jgi:hypothetical protein
MQLLRAGVDTSVIALWLGHEHVKTTHPSARGSLYRIDRRYSSWSTTQGIMTPSVGQCRMG